MEIGSACRSERSNWFLVLYVPRFKTLWQWFERTPESEHVDIWEIAHIGRTVPEGAREQLPPLSTLQQIIVACPF